MLTLAENPTDTLSDMVLERWSHDGIKSRHLDRNELKRLANYFLKTCREQNIDYQSIDFYSLLDSNNTFLENRQQIIYELGELPSTKEAEAVNSFIERAKEDYGITINKKFKPVQELEEKNIELQEKYKKTEAMLKQALTQQPKINIQQQPQQQPIEKAITYTQEELNEIIEYLQKPKKQSKQTKQKKQPIDWTLKLLPWRRAKAKLWRCLVYVFG